MKHTLPRPANKLAKTSTQQPMQRCSNYNRSDFARRRDCQSNSYTLIGGWFVKKNFVIGCHRRARRTVKPAKTCCELRYNSGALFKMCNRSQIKKVVIFAIVNKTSTGFEPVTSRHRFDALTNWAMKPLTLEVGHLWALVSPWGVDKWWNDIWIILYIESNYIIPWVADVKIK